MPWLCCNYTIDNKVLGCQRIADIANLGIGNRFLIIVHQGLLAKVWINGN